MVCKGPAGTNNGIGSLYGGHTFLYEGRPTGLEKKNEIPGVWNCKRGFSSFEELGKALGELGKAPKGCKGNCMVRG